MKRSLADILIENSKVTKRVNGELSTPSVDNIHTPDNHTSGRKSRAVDGKRGLGDRKSGKVAQVTPPKKGEKRKMREEAARMTNSAGPAQGNGRTPAGKRSVPVTITNTKGNQRNRDEGIAKRKRMASPTVPSRSLEEDGADVAYILKNEQVFNIDTMFDDDAVMRFDLLDANGEKVDEKDMTAAQAHQFLDQTGAKVISAAQYRGILNTAKRNAGGPQPMGPTESLGEGLGDNPDSKASMPFSKARNKDEGMKTPKVAKGKGVARGAKIGSVGDPKKNPANIDKTRKMDKNYIGGVTAPVAKIKEGLEDLADFLGTDLRINSDIVESNYPDGMDHSYLDDDGSEAAYEEAVDNMKYEVNDFLKTKGAGYIADYQKYVNDPRAEDDTSWFDEHLAGLVEAAYQIAMSAFNVEGFDFEVDEDTLKPMLQQFMKQAGVAEEHIPLAFSDYMYEERMAEDSLDSDGPARTTFSQGEISAKSRHAATQNADNYDRSFQSPKIDPVIDYMNQFMKAGRMDGSGSTLKDAAVSAMNRFSNQMGWTKGAHTIRGLIDAHARSGEIGEDVGSKYTKSGMGKTGRQVVLAFLNQQQADNSKLHTDGTTIDILGLGGNRVAWWENGKIYFRNTSGRADQALQKTIKKMAAPNDIASIEDNRRVLGMGEMSSGGAVGSGAIASSAGGGQRPKGSIFAGQGKSKPRVHGAVDVAVDEAHGNSIGYADYSRAIQKATTEDDLYAIESKFSVDTNLTHNEISELQSSMYARIDNPNSGVQPGPTRGADAYGRKFDRQPANESRYGLWTRK